MNATVKGLARDAASGTGAASGLDGVASSENGGALGPAQQHASR
jgi:hypothetical protein